MAGPVITLPVENQVVTPFVYPASPGAQSVQLDGINDFLDVGDFTQYDFGNTDFCFIIWVKRNATGTIQYLINKRSTAGNPQFELYFTAGNNITISYYVATAVVSQTTTAAFASTAIWYQIVAQKRSGAFEIYVNGVNQTLGALTGAHGTMDATGAPLQFGRLTLGATNQYNGYMTQISFWNVSYSALTVTVLYNAGIPTDARNLLTYALGNCKGYWPVSINLFPTIADTTAFGAYATMTNMVSTNITSVYPS